MKVSITKTTMILFFAATINLNCSFANRAALDNSDEKPIPVQAEVLMKEYEENFSAASAKYNGKLLAVSGEINGLGQSNNTFWIYLGTKMSNGTEKIYGVNCRFPESEKAKLSSLKQGQQTTCSCKNEGVTTGWIILENCRAQ